MLESRFELIAKDVPVMRGDHDRPLAALAVQDKHPMVSPQGVTPNFRLALEPLRNPGDI
ncbi:uncharacterized protein METZ01_LOCUS136740 [marine metagenome]|uniref:Uncharacterized protein n=1 Tax=marine metagenome TaxID=408172 RepID=A0A381Z3L4_9ZZZZ